MTYVRRWISLRHNKMLMKCLGRQEKEIGCAKNIIISKRKSDLPSNPDYCMSLLFTQRKWQRRIAVLTQVQHECWNFSLLWASSKCAAANEKEQLEKEREEERNHSFIQLILHGFKNNHGAYYNSYELPCETPELVLASSSYRMQASLISEENQSPYIPIVIGRCLCYVLFIIIL